MGWMRTVRQVELSHVLDYLFARTLGRLPYYRRFAPDIDILGDSDALARDHIQRHLQMLRAQGRIEAPSFIDIGARNAVRDGFATGYDYHALDITPQSDRVIYGDICDCPQVASDSFDVVFSYDVFEHLQRPWAAAHECVRIARPGGLLVHRTLFAYRYHPEPHDYWRFTSQGLEYLFTSGGAAETLVKGYDLRGRRRDRRGVYLNHRPPIDWLGGFRENWQVMWIGRKRADNGAKTE